MLYSVGITIRTVDIERILDRFALKSVCHPN